VGLVTGACFADAGNHVICVDVDADKVARLNRGEVPIHEPGLDDLIERNMKAGRIEFTTDAKKAVAHGLFQIIAVGTPPGEDGSADLQYVLAVARTIAENLQEYAIVMTKSTVPVGTADKVKAEITSTLAKRGAEVEFDVVSNPEFLKEGAAIADFMKPDRVVVGTDNPRTMELLRALYDPFTRSRERFVVMDVRSSELTKYAANAMLATKISFMNELANIAERVGADIEKVRIGIGSDPRIGYSFIYPGSGYGGSCFPKDVKALVRSAREVGYDAQVLNAVESVNAQQKGFLARKVRKHFGEDLSGRCFALWGLAFKPNTDDMREAPALTVISELLAAGATIRAFDPVAMNEARRVLKDRQGITYTDDAHSALEGADALLLLTEWQEFRSPDFDLIRGKLKQPVIFDGRNLYNPELMKRFGFEYYGVGRGKA
jgi:UDPglucose 6-dehydrogenase